MKFLFYLVMFFLLLNGYTTAQSLIQDSCKKAAAKNPKFIYDFCVKSLEENPQSKTAKRLGELVFASTKNAVMKTTSLKEMVDKILKENKSDVVRPLHDCLELYTDATDSLNQSLGSLKSRNYKNCYHAYECCNGCTGNLRNWIHRKKKPQKSRTIFCFRWFRFL